MRFHEFNNFPDVLGWITPDGKWLPLPDGFAHLDFIMEWAKENDHQLFSDWQNKYQVTGDDDVLDLIYKFGEWDLQSVAKKRGYVRITSWHETLSVDGTPTPKQKRVIMRLIKDNPEFTTLEHGEGSDYRKDPLPKGLLQIKVRNA